MLSLEQMILFSAGVVIVITVFSIFTTISDKTRKQAEEDQMKEVASAVAGAMIATTQGESTVRMLIPEKLAGSQYSVDVNTQNVTVTIGGRSIDLPLEGIGNGYSISGTQSSATGRLIITRTGNSIKLIR